MTKLTLYMKNGTTIVSYLDPEEAEEVADRIMKDVSAFTEWKHCGKKNATPRFTITILTPTAKTFVPVEEIQTVSVTGCPTALSIKTK